MAAGPALYLTDPHMQGDDVILLQHRLLELGYNEVGTVDGDFGQMTDDAVRHFQEVNGLEMDGVVGPKTWERMFSPEAIGVN
jgi:peptidoglycan hydrolase-like protein with peptidoglycan-binding domain